MRLTAPALACLMFALPAYAATVSADLEHGFVNVTGAQAADPTFNKPIDYTTVIFDFTQTSGLVDWGATAEMFQNGRAGLASDKIAGHVGHTFKLGPFTVVPQLQLGYARGPNLDYGLVGGELRASVQTPFIPPLSTEFAVRRRQSFGVNYLPNLKGSGLPTNPWSESRAEIAEVWQVNSRVAFGIHGDIDRGSNPDKVLGVFTRLTF